MHTVIWGHVCSHLQALTHTKEEPGTSLLRQSAGLLLDPGEGRFEGACWRECPPLPPHPLLARAFPFPVVGIRTPSGVGGVEGGLARGQGFISCPTSLYPRGQGALVEPVPTCISGLGLGSSLPPRMRTLSPYSLGKGMKSQGRENASWFSHYIEVFHSTD